MKLHQVLLAGTAACGLLICEAAAVAQTTANRLDAADSTFATKATQGGMAEVRLGQLAKEKAESQVVKDFGQRMIDDHSKANDELKQVASKDGITLPTTLDSKDQATYDRLHNLSGAAFDKAYMRDMVADHRADITAFKREADHGTNPDLKTFASNTLPTLEEHLKMAQSTESQAKGEK